MIFRDPEAKENVETTEGDGHDKIAERRDEERDRNGGQEAEAHGGEERNRERAAAEDARAVAERPDSWERVSPRRWRAAVRIVAARTLGRNVSATLRPGPLVSGSAARRAFRYIAGTAMARATTASRSQTASHALELVGRAAIAAAASAVRPMATCPQPGVAVNEEERSMVSRMKRRSSSARCGSGRERKCGRRMRSGWRSSMKRKIAPGIR
jgi:hypothetical protein